VCTDRRLHCGGVLSSARVPCIVKFVLYTAGRVIWTVCRWLLLITLTGVCHVAEYHCEFDVSCKYSIKFVRAAMSHMLTQNKSTTSQTHHSMGSKYTRALLKICCCLWAVTMAASLGVHKREVFTNHFSVHVPAGLEAAHHVAKRHGFVNLGSVRERLE
jgi:hypothetical protein